jgi:hypothetical protein
LEFLSTSKKTDIDLITNLRRWVSIYETKFSERNSNNEEYFTNVVIFIDKGLCKYATYNCSLTKIDNMLIEKGLIDIEFSELDKQTLLYNDITLSACYKATGDKYYFDRINKMKNTFYYKSIGGLKNGGDKQRIKEQDSSSYSEVQLPKIPTEKERRLS